MTVCCTRCSASIRCLDPPWRRPPPHPQGIALTEAPPSTHRLRPGSPRLAAIGLLALPVLAGCVVSAPAEPGAADFTAIFDGRSLDGWADDPTYWRVEDGSIVGEVTASTLLDRNSWLRAASESL